MIVEMDYKGIRKVISGGQDGTDRAALMAAISKGYDTGGWAPKGWRTISGPQPILANLGLKEHSSEGYSGRTTANVKDSDGTLIIAHNFSSTGTALTIRQCERFKKPYFKCSDFKDLDNIVKWIIENNIEVLNVAGNRETPEAPIFTKAFVIVGFVLEELSNLYPKEM